LANPVVYMGDFEQTEGDMLEIKYSIPYSDLTSLSLEKLQAYLQSGSPLEYGHSLTDLIGGQCEAGFVLTGFYEDYDPTSPLARYTASYFATRALKL
jgi:hypothetical protein